MKINVDNVHLYKVESDSVLNAHVQVSAYKSLCSIEALAQLLILATELFIYFVFLGKGTNISAYFIFLSIIVYASIRLINKYSTDIIPYDKIKHDIGYFMLVFIVYYIVSRFVPDINKVIDVGITIGFIHTVFDEISALKKANTIIRYYEVNSVSDSGDSK